MNVSDSWKRVHAYKPKYTTKLNTQQVKRSAAFAKHFTKTFYPPPKKRITDTIQHDFNTQLYMIEYVKLQRYDNCEIYDISPGTTYF
jgi:hypothetical protein